MATLNFEAAYPWSWALSVPSTRMAQACVVLWGARNDRLKLSKHQNWRYNRCKWRKFSSCLNKAALSNARENSKEWNKHHYTFYTICRYGEHTAVHCHQCKYACPCLTTTKLCPHKSNSTVQWYSRYL